MLDVQYYIIKIINQLLRPIFKYVKFFFKFNNERIPEIMASVMETDKLLPEGWKI